MGELGERNQRAVGRGNFDVAELIEILAGAFLEADLQWVTRLRLDHLADDMAAYRFDRGEDIRRR